MNPSFSLLVVDDERQHRALLTELLQDEYRIVVAKNGAQALTLAREHHPDLILLDILMPGMNGFEVIRELKKVDELRSTPVIFISALDSVADEEMGLNLGAVDYIAKPFRPPIVQVRIRNHLQVVHQRRLLEQLAMIDGLTEIPNRRRFNVFFEQERRRSQRSASPLSVLIVDVDHFKNYNDTYGHPAGDVVLRQVAKTLQAALRRPADFVARYGGEEFIVVLPDVDAQGGQALAWQLCRQVQNLQIRHASTADSPWLTISVGGATSQPGKDEVGEQLIVRADHQLYHAKRTGRNRVCWSTTDAGLSTAPG